MNAFYQAAGQLSREMQDKLLRIKPNRAASIQEIRLRSGRPVALSAPDGNYMLAVSGELTQEDQSLVWVDQKHLDACFMALCGHSVYAYENDIKQGFFTLNGGHRVGIAGLPQYKDHQITGYRSITGLNIRIARAAQFALGAETQRLLAKEPADLLLVGPPGSGKTTLLIEMASCFSRMGKRTSLIDERVELFPVSTKGPQSDIPLHCDVISDMSKPQGILHALRCMGPQVILCDELGGRQDALAVQKGRAGGVGFACSIHGYGEEDLKHFYAACPGFRPFSSVVYLWGASRPGQIKAIHCC